MRGTHIRALVCGAVAALIAATAFAQAPAPAPVQAPAPQAPPQVPQQPTWDSFPTMLLERIYRGPMKDTIIQRWRDPIDGSVCYIYLPISVPTLPAEGGYYRYGAASVGNISCIHPTEVLQLWEGSNPPTTPSLSPMPRPNTPAAPPNKH